MDEVDYIVVGAGSAGAVIAGRLSEDPDVSVLVLEAGGSDMDWRIRMPGALRDLYRATSKFNWGFKTVPQTHLDNRRIYQPRGKVLGGSSSINGMLFARGHAQDYERWAQEGARGWSYAEVLPYFKRLETYEPGSNDYRGGTGPMRIGRPPPPLDPLAEAFLEAGAQAGYPVTDDCNGVQQEGFCRFDMSVSGGIRMSSARGYLHPNRSRANLTIRTHALTEAVVMEGNRAVGVRVRHKGAVQGVRARREVILSAGAVGSPQILLLSGIGPAGHLRQHGIKIVHDLPGVGGNLQDHLEVQLQHRCNQDVTLNRYLRPDRMVRLGLQWFLFKSGICARNQVNVGAFLRSNPSAPHPNVQLHFFPVFIFGDWQMRHDIQGYLVDTGTMRATSRGTIRLASADPAAAPLIDPNYLATPEDRDEMLEAFQIARDLLAQPALARFSAGEASPGPDCRTPAEIAAFIRATAGSAYHPCGTCRMGAADDAMAVVTPDGRVRGLQGLRVADSSIMPSIPSSNLNAIALMIGEKIADAIAGLPPLPRLDAPYRNAPHPGPFPQISAT